MDTIKKDDRKEENMVFLNGLLAAFVEDVIKEYAARQDADDRIISGITDGIMGIMETQFGRSMSCGRGRPCPDGRVCDKRGVCVSKPGSFAWPFLDAR